MKCPICGKSLKTTICTGCGFSFAKHPIITVSKIDDSILHEINALLHAEIDVARESRDAETVKPILTEATPKKDNVVKRPSVNKCSAYKPDKPRRLYGMRWVMLFLAFFSWFLVVIDTYIWLRTSMYLGVNGLSSNASLLMLLCLIPSAFYMMKADDDSDDYYFEPFLIIIFSGIAILIWLVFILSILFGALVLALDTLSVMDVKTTAGFFSFVWSFDGFTHLMSLLGLPFYLICKILDRRSKCTIKKEHMRQSNKKKDDLRSQMRRTQKK